MLVKIKNAQNSHLELSLLGIHYLYITKSGQSQLRRVQKTWFKTTHFPLKCLMKAQRISLNLCYGTGIFNADTNEHEYLL